MCLKNKGQKHTINILRPLALKHKRLVLLFALVLSFCSPLRLMGQYYVGSNNIAHVKFRQIKTKNFQLVFPAFYEKKAQELARILDTTLPYIAQSLKVTPPKVPILIHTGSAKSNGLTVWAPKRIEFWTTPPMDSYPYPYLWQLAIHEYRHACQMEAMNVGFTKYSTLALGEHVLGAVSGIFAANWLLEGDAVAAETALAPTGRGQTPLFNMYLKAMMDAGKEYSPDKLLLGSMRDFVPDMYNMGYFIVSYARMKYGRDIWGDNFANIGYNWWNLCSRRSVYDKNIKLDFESLYHGTSAYLKQQWAEEDSCNKTNNNKFDSKTISRYDGHYCNYKNPIQIDDSTVLALKSSSYRSQSLVKIDFQGREEHLLYVPYLMGAYFDYKDSCILYSQYAPNIRWQQESGADIVEYDLKRNRYRRLTKNATIFCPTYFAQDSVIVAIKTDSLDVQKLSIVAPDATFFKNRHFMAKIKSVYLKTKSLEGSYSLSYPTWEEKEGDVFLISTDPDGKHIVKYHREEESFSDFTPRGFDDITRLKYYKGRVFLLKDIDNKYQLISINASDSTDVQIHSNEPYGVDSYSIYKDNLVLSSYTAEGYKLVTLPLEQEKTEPENNSSVLPFTDLIQSQENFLLTTDKTEKDTVFEVKKYNKFFHAFNFHSWAPLFVDIEAQEIGWGASVMSQNLMSTSVLDVGFNFHFYDKNSLYLHYKNSSWYPIIDFTTYYYPRDVRKSLDSNKVKYLNFDEVSIKSDISLPFTWINRNFYNSTIFTIHYSHTRIFNNDMPAPITLFNSVGATIELSNYSDMAENDLYPRFGHISMVKYLKTLTNDNAYILAASTQLFVPSFFNNHSWSVKLSMQFNTPDIYYFHNEIDFVRGVHNMYPKKYYGILLCYSLPLFYPDGGVKNIVYSKRISARPFYNIGFYDKERFQSFGAEIFSKTHILKITIPLDIGIRLGYVRESKDFFASFLFNMNI